jgi:hypothetical protein
MNDVLDFMKIVRDAAGFYLWAVFIVASVFLIADLTKGRAQQSHREDASERKAA